MSYKIKRDYIPHGQSRSGQSIRKVLFIVAHDTGNPGSTAAGNVKWFKGNPVNASAHTFIDDKEIIEMVPLSEKAWHVLYNVTTDNRIFGDDANDAAIGVELCFGGRINFEEAYKRYVWYLGYLCKKYRLNPKTHIVGHSLLDPGRKTDPENALRRYNKTFNNLITDVLKSMKGGTVVIEDSDPMSKGYLMKGDVGKAVQLLQQKLNVVMNMKLATDSSYGPGTEAAVKDFQRKYKLTVDGYFGPNTQIKLDDEYKRIKNDPMADGYIELGETGKAVESVQLNLNKLMNAGLAVDGSYGPATVGAVKAFQKKYGLKVDGFFGPNTQKTLQKALSDFEKKENKKKEEENELEKTVIVVNSFADFPSVEQLAKRQDALISLRSVAEKRPVAKHVIVAGGGKKGLKADKITDLSGATRLETAANIEKYMSK